MAKGNKVYTTGEVSKICKVAPRTVVKWIDRGLFPGSYQIPGSHDRRIPRETLVKFLFDNDMPPLSRYEGVTLIYCIGEDPWQDVEQPEDWTVDVVYNEFDLGTAYASGGNVPDAVVVFGRSLQASEVERYVALAIQRSISRPAVVVLSSDDRVFTPPDYIDERAIFITLHATATAEQIAQSVAAALESRSKTQTIVRKSFKGGNQHAKARGTEQNGHGGTAGGILPVPVPPSDFLRTGAGTY